MVRKSVTVLSVLLTVGMLFYFHSRLTQPGKSKKLSSTIRSPMAYPSEVFVEDTAYPVTRIIDGDTVEIRYEDDLTSVALIGVDTPETVHPEKPVERFGTAATAFLENLLLGESVYLRFEEERTDRYGRLLAYLFRAPDGVFVNLEIVRQGYGKVYTDFPFAHKALFEHYSGQAQQSGRGLWGAGDAVAPMRETPVTQTVYVTRAGTKYHRENCRHLGKSKIAMALDKAKESYSPCAVCKP